MQEKKKIWWFFDIVNIVKLVLKHVLRLVSTFLHFVLKQNNLKCPNYQKPWLSDMISTNPLLLSRCFRKMVIILTCKLIWSLMHFSRCRLCISNLDVMTRHNFLYTSRVFCLRWYTDSCYLTSHCILDIYIRSTKQRVSCYHNRLR